MGRFYKTSKPEMIDFMFKLPEQAMMAAVKGADAQLEGQEQYLTDLQKQLKTAALDPDEKRRKARVTELEKKISEHSLKIWENPLAALKEQKGIRDLGQEIFKDLTEGELYAYNTNAAIRQQYYNKAVEDATGKDGRLNVDQVTTAMKAFDLQYASKQGAQFNKETGKFNPYGTELLYDYMDNSEYAKKTAENWEPTTTETWKKTKEGNYWKSEMKRTEILGLDDLTMGILNTMTLDEKVTQPLIQGLQHQAQIKAIEEVKRTGGDYETLYDQYFDKLYQQEFGEIDPATGQLALKPVIDPATKEQKIDPVTKKPISEFKNPGNLYRIAQAAADKKDKNNITTKEDYDADPFDLQAAGKALELANARALEADKQPTVFDRETGEFIETTFEGSTLEEAEAGLDKQLNGLSTSVLDYRNNLFNVLTKGKNLSTEEIDKIKLKFEDLFPTLGGAYAKPNFIELEKYLASVGFEGDVNVTGVKEFKQQWESSYSTYENKKELLKTMKEQTKENLPDIDKANYKAFEIEEDIARTKLSQYEKDLEKSNLKDYGSEGQLKKLIAAEEEKIKNARAQKKKIISNNLNLNPEDTEKNADGTNKNRNTLSFSTYQTHGDLLRGLGVEESKVARVNKVLNDAKKSDFFSLFGGASGAGTFIRNKKGNAMEPFKGSTLGEYFTQPDKYTKTYDEDSGELIIKSITSGDVVLKGNVGDYYIAIDDLDRLGTNSIATTISGSQIINGKPVPVTFDLYTNQLTSTDIKSAIADVSDELSLLAFERKAQKMIEQSKSPKFKVRNDSGRVLYSKSPQGEGIFEFYDDNGNRFTEVKNSKAALAYWKKFK